MEKIFYKSILFHPKKELKKIKKEEEVNLVYFVFHFLLHNHTSLKQTPLALYYRNQLNRHRRETKKTVRRREERALIGEALSISDRKETPKIAIDFIIAIVESYG